MKTPAQQKNRQHSKIGIHNRHKALLIAALTIAGCLIMGASDVFWKPPYFLKSAVKLIVFAAAPFFVLKSIGTEKTKRSALPKKTYLMPLALGFGLIIVVYGAYMIFRIPFDFSAIPAVIEERSGVTKENYLYVALWLTFGNSLAKEYFFRGFCFLGLLSSAGRAFAHVFSAAVFSLYHASMITGFANTLLTVLMFAGLFIDGLIFNAFNEKTDSILPS